MSIEASEFGSAGETVPEFLTVEVHNHGDRDVVSVQGEIDLQTGPLLRGALRDLVVRGQKHLVVDLDEVTFIDSTGLGILLESRRLVSEAGGSLGIVCHAAGCLRLFEISGLIDVFTFHDSVAEALSA